MIRTLLIKLSVLFSWLCAVHVLCITLSSWAGDVLASYHSGFLFHSACCRCLCSFEFATVSTEKVICCGYYVSLLKEKRLPFASLWSLSVNYLLSFNWHCSQKKHIGADECYKFSLLKFVHVWIFCKVDFAVIRAKQPSLFVCFLSINQAIFCIMAFVLIYN